MHVVEDLAPEAVPNTTSEFPHMSQAEKMHQCGPATIHQVFTHTMEGVVFPPGTTMKIIELFAHVGETVKAALLLRRSLTGVKLSIHSFAANELEQEWLTKHITLWYRKKFMDEELKIPGMEPLPAEMPDDMKEHAAVRPQLQLCAVSYTHLTLPTKRIV